MQDWESQFEGVFDGAFESELGGSSYGNTPGQASSGNSRARNPHGRINTSDKEKAESMLTNDSLMDTLEFLRKRTTRPVTRDGATRQALCSCAKGCCERLDVLWLKEVRANACVLGSKERRQHLIRLLRDNNTSADVLKIEGCTVNGRRLCNPCFREVFKVRVHGSRGNSGFALG